MVSILELECCQSMLVVLCLHGSTLRFIADSSEDAAKWKKIRNNWQPNEWKKTSIDWQVNFKRLHEMKFLWYSLYLSIDGTLAHWLMTVWFILTVMSKIASRHHECLMFSFSIKNFDRTGWTISQIKSHASHTKKKISLGQSLCKQIDPPNGWHRFDLGV